MTSLRFPRRRSRRPDTMTVVEHLDELRSRLIVSLLSFAVISVAAFMLFTPILEVLRRPLCGLDPDILGPQGCDLFFTGALGGLQVRLKVTALGGIIFSSPVWLYEIWAFVSPGLHSRERRYAVPFILSSMLLFAGGLSFAYMSLPSALDFLVRIAGPDLIPLFRAEEYLSFVALVFIAFGLMFELPLLLFFLGLAGAVSVAQLRKARRLAVVAIVALAAVVTPSQDPYTLLALSVPLYALYELTILLLALVLRRRARRTAASSASA